MPQIQFPTTDKRRIVKPSEGEIFGNVWATQNLDFTANKGKVRPAQKLYRVYGTSDDADFDVPVAFIQTNADQTLRYWALTQANGNSITDGLLWKTSSNDPLTGWGQDAIASSPTLAVDNMVTFGKASGYDRLVVSIPTDLSMLNNGAWTASWWQGTLGQSALSSSNPHHTYQFSNLLLVPDGNVLHVVDDSLVVVANRITLPAEFQIVWIGDDGNKVYLGTRNTNGGETYVFPWIPTASGNTTYERPKRVYDSISYAGIPLDGVMHIINGKGQLMKDNGVDFTEVASFPVTPTLYRWKDDLTIQKLVHPNGMKIIDRKKISILANGSINGVNSRIFQNMPGGVWEYDPDIGLYPKHLFGQYDGSTLNDWGSPILQRNGALLPIPGNTQTRFIAGAAVYTDNLSTISRNIYAMAAVQSNIRGYFVTSQFQSTEFQSFWKRLKAINAKMQSSSDSILVKYRTSKNINFEGNPENMGLQISITWSTTSRFTTTTSTFSNAAVGDEIEIIAGKGAGALAHITAISLNAGTYTVDIDETISNAAGTAFARIQNWVKLKTIASQTAQKALCAIIKKSKWIQFKVELRGALFPPSPELEGFIVEFENKKR